MSPTQYSLDMNLHRRHLSESQRAMIGSRALESFEKEAEQNLHLSKGHGVKKGGAEMPHLKGRGPRSRDKVAETLNIGGRTVQQAKKVLTDGVPELAEAVDAGDVKVPTNPAWRKSRREFFVAPSIAIRRCQRKPTKSLQ